MHRDSVEIDIRVPNKTQYLRLIGTLGEGLVKELYRYSGDRETLAEQVNLVLTEAVTNAMRYGGEGDFEQSVHIIITLTETELCVKIFDYGQGFDLDGIPTPDFENPEDKGRGIYIMKSLMDSVSYKMLANYNILEMCKKLK